jgi:tRNA wybutosine-synthesizing protein 2
MGYLYNTSKFFPYALLFLKQKGFIHYHSLYKKDEIWKKTENDISVLSSKNNCIIRILNKRKVKSYAPNIYHIVLDLYIEKQ